MQQPPLTPIQKTDNDHLKLLVIFHYIYGVFSALGILFIGLHYFIMSSVFRSPQVMSEFEKNASSEIPFNPETFIDLFVWFYILMGLSMIGIATLNILSARFITLRKNRTFSMVTAGINCLQMPLGTALGVFTFIVLLRDSVRRTYEKITERIV